MQVYTLLVIYNSQDYNIYSWHHLMAFILILITPSLDRHVFTPLYVKIRRFIQTPRFVNCVR